MPQAVAPTQSRRKLKEEEKAIKASRARSRERSKSPEKQKPKVDQPKAGVPAEEVPPKVGSKRGRPPKKSPDNIESSFKRLSKALCLTFIELDDQTHLSPAVGN